MGLVSWTHLVAVIAVIYDHALVLNKNVGTCPIRIKGIRLTRRFEQTLFFVDLKNHRPYRTVLSSMKERHHAAFGLAGRIVRVIIAALPLHCNGQYSLPILARPG